MTVEESSKIVDKLNKDTINELSEYFKYWCRNKKMAGIYLTQEFCMQHVPEIQEKPVGELSDQEKLIMFIHWFIGDEKLPEPVHRDLSAEEKFCIKAASGFMHLFTETYAERINELFNKEEGYVESLLSKYFADLTTSELLVLLANMEWKKMKGDKNEAFS